MTMPVAPGTRVVELPESQFPFLKMMFTDNIAPDGPGPDLGIRWLVGALHPYAPTVRIRRMFVANGGVEIYSAADDGGDCTRDLIPMQRVRIVQEVMPIEVFVEELIAAEAGDDEDDGDDESELEPEPELGPGPTSEPAP